MNRGKRWVFLSIVFMAGLVGLITWLWFAVYYTEDALSVNFVFKPKRDGLIPVMVYGVDIICEVNAKEKKDSYLLSTADTLEQAPIELTRCLREPPRDFVDWFRKTTGMKLSNRIIRSNTHRQKETKAKKKGNRSRDNSPY